MQVKVAKSAGFCFGVKRAVDKVYQQIDTGEKIYTYGPIIHNEEVVADLERRGVVIINGVEELSGISEGTVIIRSHGVSKDIYDMLKKQGLKIVDATCPFVLKIHKTVEEKSEEGYRIVIVGNDGHPEVEGIKGWCKNGATIIGNREEAENFVHSGKEPICIVSQTTFHSKKFQDIVEIIDSKRYNCLAVNTICSATEERQSEAREIAREADLMIVIGGKSSSNSRKLYEICSEECANTHFIQTLDDLYLEISESIPCVGITAGASTPNKIIEEVQKYVRYGF